MLGYIILAILDCYAYILGGTNTPCPDTIFKLHEFEFGAEGNIWGSH